MTSAFYKLNFLIVVSVLVTLLADVAQAQGYYPQGKNPFFSFQNQHFDTNPQNIANQTPGEISITGATNDLYFLARRFIPRAFMAPVTPASCRPYKGFYLTANSSLGQVGDNNIQLYDLSTLTAQVGVIYDPIAQTQITQLTNTTAFSVAYINPPTLVTNPILPFNQKKFPYGSKALIFINTNRPLSTSDHYVSFAGEMVPYFGRRSFLQIAAHELGHAIWGLDHTSVTSTNPPANIMDPFYADRMRKDYVTNDPNNFPSPTELIEANVNHTQMVGGCLR